MGSRGRLSGRAAIVTGAGRGIGLAIARRLAGDGAEVLIGDRDAEVAEQAVAEAGAALAAFPLDVTDEAQAAAIVAEAEQRFGQLDILVNNAAILDMTPFEELSLARFQEVLRINLDSVLLMTMAAVPALARAGGGRIVNIASIMGLFGAPESVAYATAKGGVVNLTRCLACDLAPRNITVNAVAPGFIDTRMAVTRAGDHEHQTELFKTFYIGHGKIPLRRAGTPEDIAGPVSFLCSDDSRYMTAQIISVDGGVGSTF